MIPLNQLGHRTFNTRVYTGADPIPENDHPDAPKITLDGSHLDVNGIIVPDPEYHLDTNTITWKHDVPGFFWAGKVHFNHDGNIVTGHIVAGKHHSEAKLTTFVGCIKPTTYLTKVVDLTGNVQDGPRVTIGYKMDPEMGFPTQVFQIEQIDYDEVEINPGDLCSTIYKLRESETTVEHANADPESCPVAMEFNLTFDARQFKGTFEKLVSMTDEGKPVKERQQWIGEIDQTQQAACSAPALGLAKLDIPHMGKQIRVYAQQESGRLNETSAYFEQRMHPRVTYHSAIVTVNPLSVMELFCMSEPPEGVQDEAQKLLMRNMKYYLKDEWRGNLLGEEKPLITIGDPGATALDLPEAEQFYGYDFAMGYFGNAFYLHPPPGSKKKISEDDGYKLKYYLAKGLPKNKHYNEQTQSLYLDAFLLKEPRLQDYIEDQKTREARNADDKDYWAKKLYDVLVSDQQINIQVSRLIHDKLDPIDVYKTNATVLNLLQPSGELAGKMMEKINCALLQFLGIKSVQGDRDIMLTWLQDMIEAYLNEFLLDPSISADSQEKQAKQESEKELKKLKEIFGGFPNLAEALVDAILATKVCDGASLPNKVLRWIETFKQKNPKIAGNVRRLPHTLLCTMYAGGLFALAAAIKGWDHLTEADRANSITEATINAGHLFVDTYKIMKWSGNQMIQLVERVESLSSVVLDRMRTLLSVMYGEKELFTEMAKALSRFYKGPAGIVVGAGEMLNSLVRNLAEVLRVLGPLVALGAACFTAHEFYEDIRNGARGGVTAMDSLMLISSLLEAVFLAADLLLSVSWAGPLALVCAVVGANVTLVKLFLPKKPKPSPVEVFISNDLREFTETLERPPKDWIEEQREKYQ